MKEKLGVGKDIEGKILMIVFEGNKYFYKWEMASGILCIYDSKQYKIGTTKAIDFYKESEGIKELGTCCSDFNRSYC